MPRLQNLNSKVRVARKKKPKAKPKPTVTAPPPPDNSSLAQDIQNAIARMPPPKVTVPTPVVNVKAPEVNVTMPTADEIGAATAKALNKARPLPVSYHARIIRDDMRDNRMTGATVTPVFK